MLSSLSTSFKGLVRMDDVSSHQIVLRSSRIRRTLHAGARGRVRLPIVQTMKMDKDLVYSKMEVSHKNGKNENSQPSRKLDTTSLTFFLGRPTI